MIHFDFIWALIALPLPLLVYWLPAKKQIQAAPLRMPTVVKGVQAQDFAPEKKKTYQLTLGSVLRYITFIYHLSMFLQAHSCGYKNFMKTLILRVAVFR